MASRKLARRLERLGTETAYAVSDEANALKAQGKTIFDFHIGDLNFGSPTIAIDATKKALDDRRVGYCSAQGILPLREAIASFTGKERGVEYTADEVCIQPGGKPVILKFLLATLDEGQGVLYPSPGYPIYESVINFLGGVPKPYTYKDNGTTYALDLEGLEASIDDNTKILIYNSPHNPIGCMGTDEELRKLSELACKYDLWVLSDEPYFHLVYESPAKSIVSFPGMKERTCLLLTASKSWGMTGWRLGAAVGPKELISMFMKLSTNDEGCTNHFVQWGCITVYENQCRDFTDDVIAQLKERRDILVSKLNEVPGFSAHVPPSTFYLWVNVTKAFQLLKATTYEEFRKRLLQDTGVSFCTREHFGASLPGEQEKFVRFAYSGITKDKIVQACDVLKNYMTSITA